MTVPLDFLPSLEILELPRESVPRMFRIDGVHVTAACAEVFPEMLYSPLKPVQLPNGGVLPAGGFIAVLADGSAAVADHFYKALRQMGYIALHAERRMQMCEQDEHTLNTTLREVWGLRAHNPTLVERVRSDGRAFAFDYMRRTLKDPSMEDVREHLRRAHVMDNGKGFSPHTACMSLWTSSNKIDARMDRYVETKLRVMILREYMLVYLRRIFRFMEMTVRVAQGELSSQRFWAGSADRRKKVPDYLRHWANLQDKVFVRPHGQHLCVHNAEDLRYAANAYEAGDVLLAGDALDRVRRSTTSNMNVVSIQRVMEATSLDVRANAPVTTGARQRLRGQATAMLRSFAPVPHNVSMRLSSATLPAEANEANARVNAFVRRTEGVAHRIVSIVDEQDDIYRRTRAVIEEFEPAV